MVDIKNLYNQLPAPYDNILSTNLLGVNVLDFGADPTGQSDCKNAFQLAFDYAKSNMIRDIIIPLSLGEIYLIDITDGPVVINDVNIRVRTQGTLSSNFSCNSIYPPDSGFMSTMEIPRNGFIIVSTNFIDPPTNNLCLFLINDPDYYCFENQILTGGYLFEGLSFYYKLPENSTQPKFEIACICFNNIEDKPYRPIIIEKCSSYGFYSLLNFIDKQNLGTITGFVKVQKCIFNLGMYILSYEMGKNTPNNLSSTTLNLTISDCQVTTSNGPQELNSAIYAYLSGNIIIEGNDFEGTKNPITIFQTVSPLNINIKQNYWKVSMEIILLNYWTNRLVVKIILSF